MSAIYVSGHRNPDTDSIVAAISYAALHRSIGDLEYEAVRLGPVNDETQRVLDYFGQEAPMLVTNMRTQVRDLDIDRPPRLNHSVTVDLAWSTMSSGHIKTMPLLKDDCSLYGMLSAGDIASYDMDTIRNNTLQNVPVFNLLSVLEGTLVNEFGSSATEVSGKVCIDVPQSFVRDPHFSPDTIVICGDNPENVEHFLADGVSCIIICRAEIPARFRELQTSTCIISTPLTARQAARIIFQAVPAERIAKTEGIVSFHLDDYLDDVKEIMLNSRFRCYPVLDREEKVVGTISRYHLLRPRRKKVVLVDHNERSQSVPGLDQAEIVEIIDHHRLGDIQTTMPVSVRNEPVGCTNTIITAMYQEKGVVPSPTVAGLMASAILSDTVMFRSPTCTKRDIAMAERLSMIAGVPLEELGKQLFSADHSGAAEDLFRTDYKAFHIADKRIGVSQITSSDSEALVNRAGEFLQIMEKMKKKEGFDIVILMLTDILKDGTELFYVGSDDIIARAFDVEPKDAHVFLPGVMSRKKQIIPALTALWG